MKNRELIIILTFCFAIVFSLNTFANTSYIFNKYDGNELSSFTVNMYENEDKTIFETKDGGSKYICNQDLSTKSYIYISTDMENRLEYTREENMIIIKGIMNGGEINKTINIDDTPWYQNFTYCLSEFANSDSDKLIFWIINPDNLKATKFLALKEEIEIIELNGEKVEAYRVKISLTGLYSLFWSTNCWYSVEDGTFLRYKGTEGPGSDEITIEIQ